MSLLRGWFPQDAMGCCKKANVCVYFVFQVWHLPFSVWNVCKYGFGYQGWNRKKCVWGTRRTLMYLKIQTLYCNNCQRITCNFNCTDFPPLGNMGYVCRTYTSMVKQCWCSVSVSFIGAQASFFVPFCEFISFLHFTEEKKTCFVPGPAAEEVSVRNRLVLPSVWVSFRSNPGVTRSEVSNEVMTNVSLRNFKKLSAVMSAQRRTNHLADLISSFYLKKCRQKRKSPERKDGNLD